MRAIDKAIRTMDEHAAGKFNDILDEAKAQLKKSKMDPTEIDSIVSGCLRRLDVEYKYMIEDYNEFVSKIKDDSKSRIEELKRYNNKLKSGKDKRTVFTVDSFGPGNYFYRTYREHKKSIDRLTVAGDFVGKVERTTDQYLSYLKRELRQKEIEYEKCKKTIVQLGEEAKRG